MKKSLIALAALAASSAFAQSTVTLYGRIDLSIQNNSASAAANGTPLGVAGLSPKTTIASGGAGASRFGVRGTEDLGGGLKANFNIETAVAADTGGVTQFGDRNVFAEVTGGFGGVRVGRFLTPQLGQVARFSAFGTDYAGAGSNIMHTEGARYNNAISYTTPLISGFSATIMTATPESNTFRVAQPLLASATTATAPAFNTASLNGVPAFKSPINIGLNFANGPIAVGLAYAKDGVSGPKGLTNIGASYNFGVARVMAQYETNANITTATGKSAYLIGATAPMGSGLLRATYGKRQSAGIEFAPVAAVSALPTTVAAFSPTNSTANVSNFNTLISVGYDHNLSKRTALYTTYTRAKAFNPVIGSFNVIQLGVGHNF